MTKIVKMSLIAAIAVAGTTASAQPLAEAIKNVDVSGTVVYRYNDYEDQANGKKSVAASDSATNNYKVAIDLKSKVNDDVTFNARIQAGKAGTTDEASLGTSNSADQNLDIEVSEVNFTYTGVNNLALTVGKQGIATPWTIHRDALGNEQTGTGAVAVYNVGPVTLVGAYFNQTNFDTSDISALVNGSEDIYVLGAMGTFSGVTVDAFYADLADVFDSYTLGVAGSFDLGNVALSPFARYTSLDLDNNSKDNSLWQIGLSAKMGMFNAFAAYGESDKDGGVVAIDLSAKTNMDYHWRVTADGSADTEYTYVHVDADVTEKVNIGLFYSDADYNSTGNNDVSEVYVQAKYKMSNNLTTYVRYGELSVDDSNEDGAMGRVHVQYSF